MSKTEEKYYDLTFSQREGEIPIPDPMKLKQIPKIFRRLAWKTIDDAFFIWHVDEYTSDWYYTEDYVPKIINEYRVNILDLYHDEIEINDIESDRRFIEDIIKQKSYHEILTFIEYVINDIDCRGELKTNLVELFDKCGPIAYYVTDICGKQTIVPRIDKESSEQVCECLKLIQKECAQDVSKYLLMAVKQMNNGGYEASIQESFRALELVCKDSSKTKSLTDALKELKHKFKDYKLIFIGIEKLVAFANNYARHPKGEQTDSQKNQEVVDLNEAILYFSCFALFARYIIQLYDNENK